MDTSSVSTHRFLPYLSLPKKYPNLGAVGWRSRPPLPNSEFCLPQVVEQADPAPVYGAKPAPRARGGGATEGGEVGVCAGKSCSAAPPAVAELPGPSLEELADLRVDLQDVLQFDDIDLLVLNDASPILRFKAASGRQLYCGRRVNTKIPWRCSLVDWRNALKKISSFCIYSHRSYRAARALKVPEFWGVAPGSLYCCCPCWYSCSIKCILIIKM